MQRVMIVFTVPETHLKPVLDAIAAAGAGVVGEYTHCSFTSAGTGRFMPSAAANPMLGERGALNAEPELRVETFCQRDRARAVVAALRDAHPYDEPVYYVIPLLDEGSL
jgi:structural hemagglutinin/hemolysin toxin protein RtxA